MGKVYSEPKFFAIDNTKIEVVSASYVEDFTKYKTLNDFGSERGKFLIDDDNNNHMIFEKENRDFVEFNIV